MITGRKKTGKVLGGILSLILMTGIFTAVKAEATPAPEIRWLPEKYSIEWDGEFYSREGFLQENLYVISNRETQLHGFAHINGEIVIPTKYFSVGRLSEGLIAVEEDWQLPSPKKGFVDKSGKMIIPAETYDLELAHRGQHHFDSKFSEGLVAVRDSFNDAEGFRGQTHFIDKSGKKILSLPPEILAQDFSEGLAPATEAKSLSKWGFIDKSGKVVIPFKYPVLLDFSEGLAVVCLNDAKDPVFGPERWGAIDKSGKVVVPIKYQNLGSFYEGRSAFERNEKWGYIDKSGKEVVPAKYDIAGDFSEELASVNIGWRGDGEHRGKWGYIDRSGKLIIPIQYEEARDFHQGLAAVQIGGKWGYIDKSGKIVVAPQFEEASDFSGGFAALRKKEKGKLIDGIMKHPLKK